MAPKFSPRAGDLHSGVGVESRRVEAHDYLTSLPSEILLKIVTQVPIKNFLDLVQTSRAFRNFIKANASKICNDVIRSRYQLEAALLQSELKAGWLVPTHDMIKRKEGRSSQSQRNLLNHPNKKYFSLIGEMQEKGEIQISMLSPGPQYLFFFEEVGLEVLSEEQALSKHISFRSQLEKSTLEGRTYFFGIPSMHDWASDTLLSQFLEMFNRRLLRFEHGKLGKFISKDRRFPREMVWFYGVERLRVIEKDGDMEENEDWKDLPVLLWD